MEKISDDAGYFLKPELFELRPFEPEKGVVMDGLPAFRVQTQPHNAAHSEAKNLSQEVEVLFMKHLERIAKRDGLEIELPEDIWMIAAKDSDTLRSAMQTLATELCVAIPRGKGAVKS